MRSDSKACLVYTLAGLALVNRMPAPEPAVADSASGWRIALAVGVKAAYDSNVFLQSTAPDPGVRDAVPADAGSLVATTLLSVGAEFRSGPGFSLQTSYAPELTRFFAEPSESHEAHRTTLALHGRTGETTWTLQTNATWIDGSTESPIFGGPGGAPAIGGAGIRDRRDAFMGRGSFKLTQPLGHWFIRPVGNFYRHDFRTQQERRTCYTNYIDRGENTVGADVGWSLTAKSRLVTGLRVGRQYQGGANGADSPFDSELRRAVAGFEGEVTPWLQLSILAGPESRRFAPGTPAGFDRTKTLLWIDGNASLTASSRDTVTFTVRRFEQPASSGVSIYEDIASEFTWRHRFSDRLTATAGYRLLRADWQAPSVREDRIATPSVQLVFNFNRHCLTELGYSFDRATSLVPGTAGREYRREVSLAALRFSY